MYQPKLHREDRLDVQHQLIAAHPLGLLISAGTTGLLANAIPFVLDADASAKGTLRAHVARANPQWLELTASGSECLVVFQGPQAYVTPSWYATKAETAKVVPTWNYAIVQARGSARVIDDPAWLRAHVEVLTRTHEDKRAVPWEVSDAPADFIEMMLKAIVGIEIPIAAIEGKWKVSQNRPEADRRGVLAGVLSQGASQSSMAALVAEYGKIKI